MSCYLELTLYDTDKVMKTSNLEVGHSITRDLDPQFMT